MQTKNLAGWGRNPDDSKLDSRYDENGNLKPLLLARANFTDGNVVPPVIYPSTSWVLDAGSPVIENGALKMSYPPLPSGGGGGVYNSLYFYPPPDLNELFIQFDAKMPNAKHGLKFLKVFGVNATGGANTVANTTFGLDYTGIDNGSMRGVFFGDGTTQVNDTQQVVNLNGSNLTSVGRSYSAGAVIISNGQLFDSANWGTGWHTFKFKIKFNSGTTELNEVNDGEILVNIDGVDFVHAKGLFNRHYLNGAIQKVAFGDWTQSPNNVGSPSFDIHYDNIFISRNGFWGGV